MIDEILEGRYEPPEGAFSSIPERDGTIFESVSKLIQDSKFSEAAARLFETDNKLRASFPFLILQVRLARAQRRWKDAIRVARIMRQKFPEYLPARHYEAFSLLKLGRFNQARQIALECRASNPGDLGGWMLLALISVQTDKPEQAFRAWLDALAITTYAPGATRRFLERSLCAEELAPIENEIISKARELCESADAHSKWN